MVRAGSLMQHTRQQIIDYLQSRRIATSVEMSHALLVTAANIRYHLKILETTGLVRIVGHQPGRGRGRPMKLYSLTNYALQQNLEGLASALLCTLYPDIQDNTGQLDRIAANLLGNFDPDLNIHTRLKQVIDKLNQLKYQAAWEASSSGPRIILRNCPYAIILDNHPELCQMDAMLLSKVLGQPVEQTAKLERQPDGAPHCAFVTR